MYCGDTLRLLSSLDFGEDNFGGCNPAVFLGRSPTDSSKTTMLKSSRGDCIKRIQDCMWYVSVIHFLCVRSNWY